MGETFAGVLCAVMLLCGFTSPLYLEHRVFENEVTAFQIPASSTELSDVPRAALEASATVTEHISHGNHPHSLGVLQLCHPQGHEIAGFEGLPPQGMILDKSFALIVSARGSKHHSPLEGFPAPRRQCHFNSQARKSSSEKIKNYPQIVHDHKHLRQSKLGLNIFEMLPEAEGCQHDDVTAFALSKMIKLGEFLAERYRQVLPSLRKIGKDPVLASCIPEQDYFQSTSALLHGLLHEKQFTRLNVKKLERHVVRELGSHNSCPTTRDIEVFMEHAYKEEQEIFRRKNDGFVHRKHLHQSLGINVNESHPSKEVVKSLSHLICGEDSVMCIGEKCLNLTQDNISQLWQAIALHNFYMSGNDIFHSYALADTHMYIQKLFSWFLDDRDSGQVIKIDVVDDYFFLKVLTALGHDVQDPILPGSRLVIEQYQKEKSKKRNSFWRVLIDGKVVTEQLQVCSGAASKGFCGVDTIKARIEEFTKNNAFSVCTESKDEL